MWDWLRRSGRFEVAILLSLLGVIIGMWVFAALAGEVLEGDTTKYDERILLALRQPNHLDIPIGPHWTIQAARDVTAFGSASGLGIIVLTVSGFLLVQRRYGLVFFVVGSVVSGSALGLALKDLIHRPRPAVVPHLTDISSASFPSGHSMLSSVTYLTLAALVARAAPGWKTKVYCLAVAAVLITAIGFSRLYLGVHYPTDVLAGWCLGCAWAVLCCLIADFLARRKVAGFDERSPAEPPPTSPNPASPASE